MALACALALGLQAPSLAQWKPAGDRIKTEWGEKLDPANVLPEYPRPMMERKEWKNLNGLWDYAIRACTWKTVRNCGIHGNLKYLPDGKGKEYCCISVP